MTNQIDTQSLAALSEQQLLGLYATLNTELGALPVGSDAALQTSELIKRVLNVIHNKRRQQRLNHNTPSF